MQTVTITSVSRNSKINGHSAEFLLNKKMQEAGLTFPIKVSVSKVDMGTFSVDIICTDGPLKNFDIDTFITEK